MSKSLYKIGDIVMVRPDASVIAGRLQPAYGSTDRLRVGKNANKLFKIKEQWSGGSSRCLHYNELDGLGMPGYADEMLMSPLQHDPNSIEIE